MRHLLSVFRLTAFLFCLNTVSPAWAAEGWPKWEDDPRGITLQLSGKQAENVMRLVGNMPWLPDGAGKKKYLYVIYTPSCPISQALYDATRKLADKVEIRWIPIDPEGSLNSMYENRTAETVKRAFKSQQVPPDGDVVKSANINMYNTAALAYLIAGQIVSPDGNIYFPTLVYGTPDKASVSIGPVKNIAKLIEGIPETDQPMEPEALTLGAKKAEIIAVPSAKDYVNKGKERAALRIVADKAGIEVGGIPPGQGWPLPVSGVTKDGFVAFKISNSGAHIFIEDAEFVKAALAKP